MKVLPPGTTQRSSQLAVVAAMLLIASVPLAAQGRPDSSAREGRQGRPARQAEERGKERPAEKPQVKDAAPASPGAPVTSGRPVRPDGRGEPVPAPATEQAPDRGTRTAHPVGTPTRGRATAAAPATPVPTPQSATPPAVPVQQAAVQERGRRPAPAHIENMDRPGERIARTPGGAEIRRGPTGDVHEVVSRGMSIRHAPEGVRVVTVVRPDHSIIVTNRAGHGYIDRPFEYRNAPLIRRTYYVNGAPYGRIYRPYEYRGVPLVVYVPSRYYAPAFYGWAYTPWGAPVRYSWGWAGRPWYGYYSGYFAPYPVYPSASFWLTDYVIASTLESAYQERLDAERNMQANEFGNAPLTPDAKQAVADEVRRQLALESAENRGGLETPPDPATSGIARMLTDNTSHTFVVARPLVVRGNAGECQLTEGDVIQLAGQTAYDATSANVVVLSGKAADCRRGSAVAIPFADLQDMQNHMRETIDRGLAELQSKQGAGGLPPAPLPAMAAPITPDFVTNAPPVDANGNAALLQQAQAADSTERDVLSQAPKMITLGQTIESVVNTLGTPKNIVDLGDKKIYVYANLKITFIGGKVADVQ